MEGSTTPSGLRGANTTGPSEVRLISWALQSPRADPGRPVLGPLAGWRHTTRVRRPPLSLRLKDAGRVKLVVECGKHAPRSGGAATGVLAVEED
jgi:hypothetical protein